MRKTIAFAAGLSLAAGAAAAAEKNVTYQFKLLSESQRTPQGVVSVVPITKQNEILATLVLTHKAFKEGQASVSDTVVKLFTPPTVTDDGVVSFTFNQNLGLFNSPLFDFPINSYEKAFDNVYFGPYPLNLNFNIMDGELSGDIHIFDSAQGGPFCELQMTGTDGNWSGDWDCGVYTSGTVTSFTAIPFRVEPGHEHEKVSER
jgi:hypothetical protein